MAKGKAKPKVEFTDEEKKLIQGAAHAVWDECGYDVLQAVAQEKKKPIERVTCSRAEVIEIALDAGRTEERLIKNHPELVKKMQEADYDTLIRVARPAFPYARYGL